MYARIITTERGDRSCAGQLQVGDIEGLPRGATPDLSQVLLNPFIKFTDGPEDCPLSGRERAIQPFHHLSGHLGPPDVGGSLNSVARRVGVTRLRRFGIGSDGRHGRPKGGLVATTPQDLTNRPRRWPAPMGLATRRAQRCPAHLHGTAVGSHSRPPPTSTPASDASSEPNPRVPCIYQRAEHRMSRPRGENRASVSTSIPSKRDGSSSTACVGVSPVVTDAPVRSGLSTRLVVGPGLPRALGHGTWDP